MTSPWVKGLCVNALKRGFNYSERVLILCQLFFSCLIQTADVGGAAIKQKPKQFWGRKLIVHMGVFDFSILMKQSKVF